MVVVGRTAVPKRKQQSWKWLRNLGARLMAAASGQLPRGSPACPPGLVTNALRQSSQKHSCHRKAVSTQAGSQRPAAAGEPLCLVISLSLQLELEPPREHSCSQLRFGELPALEAMSGEPLLPMEASWGSRPGEVLFLCVCVHHSGEALLPSPASSCQSSWHRRSLYASSLSRNSGPKQCSEHVTWRKQRTVVHSEPVSSRVAQGALVHCCQETP